MRATLFLLPLLACSTDPRPPAEPPPSPSPPQTPSFHMQGVEVSSGEHPERMLDGDRETGWYPSEGPVDQRVTLTLGEPLRVLQASVQLCLDSAPATFLSLLDGEQNTRVRVNPGGPVRIPWSGGVEAPSFRQLELRIIGAEQKVGICELALSLPPELGTLLPPPPPERSAMTK
jgi:hypothetical protein